MRGNKKNDRSAVREGCVFLFTCQSAERGGGELCSS